MKYTNMIDSLEENRPLYKDSGLWQIRSDDMKDVIYQQKATESFAEFIERVFNDSGSKMDYALKH